MKRVLIFYIFGLCVLIRPAALEIMLAPLYLVDETEERVEAQNSLHRRLLTELSSTAAGIELRFYLTSESRYNPPQSVGDAITLCREERAEYLLYGFITRREHTVQGELRLLDYQNRTVITSFHAIENRGEEDELVAALAAKVLKYLGEHFHIELRDDPTAYMHLQIPLGIGYWLPTSISWIDLLIGIVRVHGGLQLIPKAPLFVSRGFDHYVSTELDVSYRLGRGNQYEGWNHSFTISTPVLVHRVLTDRHEVFAGGGISYTIDLLEVKKPYESPATEMYSTFGIVITGGWIFLLKEQLFFYTEGRFDWRFYRTPMVSFAPSAGIIFRPYTQEVVKKW
jgi:hypothetical protein